MTNAQASRSVQLCDPGLLEWVGFVVARAFPAQLGAREQLARVAELLRVEGAAHAAHRLDVGFGEHFAHEVALFDADAVLAGDVAAGADAELEDLGGERL